MNLPFVDTSSMIIVLTGAFAAGFVTGFAGIGTALVSSGFWFHALASPLVPPLMVLSSVVAQFVNLLSVRSAFNWKRVIPFLVSGLIGLPFGVLALAYATPDALRMTIGGLLIVYSLNQILGLVLVGQLFFSRALRMGGAASAGWLFAT